VYILQLFPLSGPQKSFSQLEIQGCGFWSSADIIMKFTCVSGSGFAAPRSCPGLLKSPGVLSCKPPRLGEAGTYEVTVAMDGSTFLPDKLYVNVYKDFNLLSISPALVDRRLYSSTQFIVVVKGIIEVPKSNTIRVRVLVAGSPESLTEESHAEAIDVIGTFRDSEDENAENLNGTNDAASLDDQQSNNKSATGIEVVDSKKYVVFNLDFDQIRSVSSADAVYMNVKLSLNDYDYCSPLPTNKSVILHSFEPVSLLPACYALDSEDASAAQISSSKREVCVCGNGFINSMGLRTGASIEAVLRAKVGKGFGEVVLPLKCYSNDRIYFIPPTVEQFVAASGLTIDAASYPTLLNTVVRFQLNSPPEPVPTGGPVHSRVNTANALSSSSLPERSQSTTSGGENSAASADIIQLSPRVLKLDLYTPQPINIVPVVCRRVPGMLLTITGVLKGGIKLRSSQARVLFVNADAGIEYLCDAEIVRMVNITDPFTDDVFTGPQVTDDATPGLLTERTTTPSELPVDATPSAAAPAVDAKKGKGKVRKTKAEVALVEIEVEYKVLLKLPTPSDEFDTLYAAYKDDSIINPAPVDRSIVPNWKLMGSTDVSLLLDGQTPVPSSFAAKMIFFDNLSIKPLPKGPFVAGSSLTLEVMGLVSTAVTPSDDADTVKCIVRFHAEASVTTRSPNSDVLCTGSVAAQTITVTLPDASQFAALEPDPSAKAAKAKGPKNYFIGISIDGGNTFDYSEKAILPVK
jgi:hypothetical protein